MSPRKTETRPTAGGATARHFPRTGWRREQDVDFASTACLLKPWTRDAPGVGPALSARRCAHAWFSVTAHSG